MIRTVCERTIYRRKAAKRKAVKDAARERSRKHKREICRSATVSDFSEIERQPMEIDYEEGVAEKMDIDKELDGSEYQLSPGTEQMGVDDELHDLLAKEADLIKVLREMLYDSTLVDKELNSHRANVCVVCDRFIIGTERVEHIEKEDLLKNEPRIGVAGYELRYGPLRPSLRKQYQVADDDLKCLLLSPRSRKKDGSHICCEQCKESLRDTLSRKIIAPPKHSIANGFAIGRVPEEILPEEDVTELLCALIAPVRPFMHVISYMGGQHKTIRGHVMLFHNDIIHTGSVLQNYLRIGANPNVYCVLCGRFTPTQREIVRQRVELNLDVWKRLLRWYITDSSHPDFAGLNPDVETWPRPHVVEERSNEHNTDEEGDPEVEETVEGATYHFPSAYEPTEDTGTCQSQEEFARSMLHGTAPTLLFYPGNYARERDVPLESILPLAFPYGRGGPRENRLNKISFEELVRHYLRLSLPQFHRGDVVQVLNSMYVREQTFRTGFIKCKTPLRGMSLADAFSKLTPEDIARAASRKDNKMSVSGVPAKFLRTVSTACRPVAYSSEAAAHARRKLMGYCDFFGLPSLFVSISPDDTMAFRLKLYLRSKDDQRLPSLNCTDEECIVDLKLRERIRLDYPGLCSLEFQHVMQIVWKVIIGWDFASQTGKRGVFGIPIAACETDEEQSKKTLHSHWLVWIQGFNKLRWHCYNDAEKQIAREKLLRYVKAIMCASYGNPEDLIMSHGCVDETTSKPRPVNEVLRPRSDQIIRDARHNDLCYEVEGRLSECVRCGRKIASSDILEKALQTWHRMQDDASRLCVDSAGDAIVPPFQKERLDVFALRHPYDYLSGKIVENSHTFVFNKKIRNCLLQSRFNEHDWEHRATCFKKGPECRAVLPKKIQDDWELHFDESELGSIFWHRIDGPPVVACPFEVRPFRGYADQYMNVHSPIISHAFGCNNNVQVGDPGHIFYNTHYCGKSTQSDDVLSFMWWCNPVCEYLKREKLRREAERDDPLEGEDGSPPNFSEGLNVALYGIRCSMSANVVSGPLAALTMSKGSRFTFSHETAPLLLSQLEDLEEGREIEYLYRGGTNNTKQDNSTINRSSLSDNNGPWPDSLADTYICRPIELENTCCFEMVMKFEVVYQKPQTNASFRTTCRRLSFIAGHPSNGRAYMRPLQKFKVPVISTYRGFEDISMLELQSDEVSPEVVKLREIYARQILLLFYPFRSFDELRDQDGTFWTKYIWAKENGCLWEGWSTVRQNIQDRVNAQKMRRVPDEIDETTMFRESEGTSRRKRKNKDDEDKFDYSATDFEAMFGSDGDGEYNNCDERSTSFIRNRVPLADDYIVDPPIISGESVFATREEEADFIRRGQQATNTCNGKNDGAGADVAQNDTGFNQQPQDWKPSFAAAIDFIRGTLLSSFEDNDDDDDEVRDDNTDDEDEENNNLFPSLSRYARKHKLDPKQIAAYEIICSTYMLQILRNAASHEAATRDTSAAIGNANEAAATSVNLNDVNLDTDEIIELLKGMGAKDQLIMFVTGAGGSGKSYVMSAARDFCHAFSRGLKTMFTENTFLITAYLGSAAALWGGVTLHSAACMNKRSITDDDRAEWDTTEVVVADEISFADCPDLQKLDKCARKLKRRPDKIYGGVHLVFSGDFHQLWPVKNGRKPVYYEQNEYWHGSINSVIFLDANEIPHRFENDPEYGRMMNHFREGNPSSIDISTINSQFVTDCSTLPVPSEETDVCYACAYNKERNTIQAAIFKKLIENNPRAQSNNNDVPDNVVVIEATFRSGTKRHKQTFHDDICQRCGDAQIKTSRNSLYDPALKFYPGIPLMINSNKDLKKRRGNGTLCRGLKLVLKEGRTTRIKNWDGHKVHTVSIDDCDHMLCEHWPREKGKSPRYFRLHEIKESVIIHYPFMGKQTTIGNSNITQFGVNSNIATTGHKLQGMSKDNIIVTSWNYRFKNWIYLVLSRVRTLSGLFLLEKLAEDQDYSVDPKLIIEEQRLKKIEEEILQQREEGRKKRQTILQSINRKHQSRK